jgi:5-(carboxyamino)imidazole ribonucleotide synthase
VPLASWRAVETLDEAVAALAALDRPCVLKPALRRDRAAGVRTVRSRAELEAAWTAFGGVRCALEEALEIDAELSVLVARGLDGTTAVYPPSRSQRVDCSGTPRLLWSVLPDGGARQHAAKARRLAGMVAERLQVEGLLAVEMFLLSDGRLVVNELVPCPHPTFLPAEQACGAGQYEQLVRAICGLPLGPTTVVRPVAVAPIYADTWLAGAASRTHVALRTPGVTMRAEDIWADEADSRVAHLAASGDTPDEAVARVLRARAGLADANAGKTLRPAAEPVRHPRSSCHTSV